MQYTSQYQSPLGDMLIAANDIGVTGLWFVGQKYFAYSLDKESEEKETAILQDTKKWLDMYFSGKEPSFKIPLQFTGTDFQNEVWKILCDIPYGQTMTYGEIATILAKKKSLNKMSAQAVGGAVGKNGITIIIPCHRVVGSNGSLTGYAGGISKKIELLKLEKGYKDTFFIPQKSTAI
ncbi:methylated-DNA--[protein]-cysteine S-methyltransferase [Streptococcus acidominimus]|uniref:Methylated-DNA--protein-cysteine methyltransferase n=1 Tax=Streptococcus acidominimus TaxID=1326 RepID=A0A4Y9FM07_STRAI|nr:methylated-DNA--[protein]-cysteine S-methyltransferase [Streptococcus acidominimus]MBF0819700.1 methylated-DNA--[protein]-cysteine S-methyltransferase [Streptococcus acidominimus]MBF0839400.1 methylated-DNA--[protein]-cysteine S-methyltransferase [Streptococcus acidominimus]MBF0846588.1 methylated-DNA--[protein]-cysteine S-methyltransferase [Streptococcus danieliae]TFU29570.1 methylated-DNA--[protein]-cysteine S-methyltransferase [Streptococcus acidominimus]